MFILSQYSTTTACIIHSSKPIHKLSHIITHHHTHQHTMAIIIPTPTSHRPLSSRIGPNTAGCPTSADMIRSRLLYKLGIYDSNYMNASIYHKIRREGGGLKKKTSSHQHQNQQQQGQQQQHSKKKKNESSEQQEQQPQEEPHQVLQQEPSIPLEEESEPTTFFLEQALTQEEEGEARGVQEDEVVDATSNNAGAPYFIPLKFDQREDSSSQSTTSLTTSIISPFLISSNPSSSLLSLTSEGYSSTDSEPPASINMGNESNNRPRRRPRCRIRKGRALSIQFNPSVTVIPIPSHRSYSAHVHAALHIPKEELAYNTVRNTREFIYEGWNWRNVVEEDKMYSCRVSGEYVHPAHVGCFGGSNKRPVNPYL